MSIEDTYATKLYERDYLLCHFSFSIFSTFFSSHDLVYAFDI